MTSRSWRRRSSTAWTRAKMPTHPAALSRCPLRAGLGQRPMRPGCSRCSYSSPETSLSAGLAPAGESPDGEPLRPPGVVATSGTDAERLVGTVGAAIGGGDQDAALGAVAQGNDPSRWWMGAPITSMPNSLNCRSISLRLRICGGPRPEAARRAGRSLGIRRDRGGDVDRRSGSAGWCRSGRRSGGCRCDVPGWHRSGRGLR